MSVDKLVDSTQLNADLTSVANAIRGKTGSSSTLAFPNGFVSEINTSSLVNTSDANVVAGEIFAGKTAYVNGNKVTGTFPYYVTAYSNPIYLVEIGGRQHCTLIPVYSGCTEYSFILPMSFVFSRNQIGKNWTIKIYSIWIDDADVITDNDSAVLEYCLEHLSEMTQRRSFTDSNFYFYTTGAYRVGLGPTSANRYKGCYMCALIYDENGNYMTGAAYSTKAALEPV